MVDGTAFVGMGGNRAGRSYRGGLARISNLARSLSRNPPRPGVRATASRGIRISDDDAKSIHLHARPWGITVHVPYGWMTDAEAGRLAGDLAHRWHREVVGVTPTRCVWSYLTQPLWSIKLRRRRH